jgi:hypothetical protein
MTVPSAIGLTLARASADATNVGLILDVRGANGGPAFEIGRPVLCVAGYRGSFFASCSRRYWRRSEDG